MREDFITKMIKTFNYVRKKDLPEKKHELLKNKITYVKVNYKHHKTCF